jgi:hypothetical protein
LEITAFDARPSSELAVVIARWTVNGEQAHHYFYIQRSPNGIDFNTLDSLTGADLDTLYSYSYADAFPLPGSSYYRVLVVGPGGDSTYSGTKEVNFVGSSATASLRISPNPVTGRSVYLEMAASKNGQLQVFLYTAQGILLSQWVFEKRADQWKQRLDLGNLPAGNYFIRVNGMGATGELRQLAVE